MTKNERNRNWRREWVSNIKRQTIERYNKLLKGNISVSQAHAERDEIADFFNVLANELEGLVKERDDALCELEKTQQELSKYRRHN